MQNTACDYWPVRPVMEDLHQFVEGSERVVMFDDAGVRIVDRFGDRDIQEELEHLGLLPLYAQAHLKLSRQHEPGGHRCFGRVCRSVGSICSTGLVFADPVSADGFVLIMPAMSHAPLLCLASAALPSGAKWRSMV